MDTTNTTAKNVPPNIEKLYNYVNSTKNPHASMELLVAMLKYRKTVHGPKEEPSPTPVPSEKLTDKRKEIERYIERTPRSPLMDRYTMMSGELAALHSMAQSGLSEALYLAFCFGQAKGYRMGKAEAKNRKGSTA